MRIPAIFVMAMVLWCVNAFAQPKPIIASLYQKALASDRVRRQKLRAEQKKLAEFDFYSFDSLYPVVPNNVPQEKQNELNNAAAATEKRALDKREEIKSEISRLAQSGSLGAELSIYEINALVDATKDDLGKCQVVGVEHLINKRNGIRFSRLKIQDSGFFHVSKPSIILAENIVTASPSLWYDPKNGEHRTLYVEARQRREKMQLSYFEMYIDIYTGKVLRMAYVSDIVHGNRRADNIYCTDFD
jgi:hypothetical protein